MPIDQKIRDKVILEGFYEEKTPDPLGSRTDAYMHRAYVMTPDNIIISYCAFLRTKDTAPLNFAYTTVNAETGKYNGCKGIYFSNENTKFPFLIEKGFDKATTIISDKDVSEELITYHRNLPPDMRNNFGDISNIKAGIQSRYADDCNADNNVFGISLGFAINCKNYFINGKYKGDTANHQNINVPLIA